MTNLRSTYHCYIINFIIYFGGAQNGAVDTVSASGSILLAPDYRKIDMKLFTVKDL